MPNKRVHDIALLLSTLGIVGYEVLEGISFKTVSLSAFGLLSGVFITPDHDLGENKLSIWWLYGKWFSHRGMSHWPVIGTFTRIIYIGAFPIALALWFKWEIYWEYLVEWFLWLCVADLIHVCLDIVVSWFKRNV